MTLKRKHIASVFNYTAYIITYMLSGCIINNKHYCCKFEIVQQHLFNSRSMSDEQESTATDNVTVTEAVTVFQLIIDAAVV